MSEQKKLTGGERVYARIKNAVEQAMPIVLPSQDIILFAKYMKQDVNSVLYSALTGTLAFSPNNKNFKPIQILAY